MPLFKKTEPINELRLVIELRDKNTDSLLYWKAGTVSNSWQTDKQMVLMTAFRFSNIDIVPEQINAKAYS